MKHKKFEENIAQDVAYSDRDFKSGPFKKIARNEAEIDSDEEGGGGSSTIKWYSQLPHDPIETEMLPADRIEALKKEANGILHAESLAYETKMEKSGSSDRKWAKSLLSKGAIGDKIAAATILIQDSPIHNLSTLRNLIGIAKPAKKKDGLSVIDTLTQLFLEDLLLPEAKLRVFESRPASKLDEMSSGNRNHRRKLMTYWMFEDQLKEIYGEFIKCLNDFAHDTVDAHKEKAVTAMSKLLTANPEREKVLLSSVVNKLGDPSQKVASKVMYHLCQVLYNHPNMKGVVLDEIEKMLFRPNISPKAQYYGVCFLNQFYLTKDDGTVAENLVRVYFSFFKACIKKGDIDTRLMSALLTGVKRCQPFLGQQKMEELQNQSDALHRLVHLARYNISLHALALLFQIAPLATQLSDRYYCALYKKLADPETLTTTLPALMMNLVYRSIKVDKCESRVLAFLKRLLQLACLSDAPRACAFLLLIARLARRRKLPVRWFVKEDEIKSEVTETKGAPESQDPTVDEKEDTRVKEENADVGNGLKTKKVEKEKKKRRKMFESAKPQIREIWAGDKTDLLDDDDDEVYQDIILEEDEEEFKKKSKIALKKKSETSRGWIHNVKLDPEDLKEETEEPNEIDETKPMDNDKELKILIKKTKNMEKIITEYNPLHRNPAYCGAEHSVICEVAQLVNHYHPTVRLFAEKIRNGAFIQYSGDPLKDFSIARFLDRFAFKNPKKDVVKSEDDPDAPASSITVKGSHPNFAKRKNYTPGGLKGLAINSAAYLNEDANHIPVDERFLYDFLQTRKVKDEDKDSDAESDADSVNSVEFESYLDKITGKGDKGDDSDESDEEVNEEETELDFMSDVLKNSKLPGKKNKKEKGEDDGEGSDWSDDGVEGADDDGDMDDEENEMSDIEGEESDLQFSENEEDDNDEDGFDVPQEGDDERPKSSNKNKVKKGKGTNSLFASAEEFATLLEETGAAKGHGTKNALSNRENAHAKQLDWESNRDRWIKGYTKQSKGPKRPFNQKGNKFQKGTKRKFNSKPGKAGGKKFKR